MKKEEKYLIKRLKSGDSKAFDLIYKTYYQSLVDFAQLFLDERFCAEEVVNEFFVWLWQNRENLKIKYNLAGYLYKSIKNRVLNKLQKKQHVVLQNLRENLENEAQLSPDQKLIYYEEQQKVQNILQLIPKRSREIFIMHRYDGLKYKEIAQLLNISVNTVENHIVKALQILRNYYKNKDNHS